MHARGYYDEDDARKVLDHVGNFMQKLAPRVLGKT